MFMPELRVRNDPSVTPCSDEPQLDIVFRRPSPKRTFGKEMQARRGARANGKGAYRAPAKIAQRVLWEEEEQASKLCPDKKRGRRNLPCSDE